MVTESSDRPSASTFAESAESVDSTGSTIAAAGTAKNRAWRRAIRVGLFALAGALVVSVVVAFLVSRPVDPAARLETARDLVVARKPEEAMKQLRRALAEVEPNHPLRLRILQRAAQVTDLHLGQHFSSEAMGYFRTIISDYPSTPEAFDAGVRIAEILKQRHDASDLAEKQYLAVAAAHPNQVGVESLLLRAARLALEQRRYVDARAHAGRILARYPHSELAPEAQFLVGNTLQLEGKDLEAAEAYEAIAERWPRTVIASRALFEAGNCRNRLADYNQAIARYIEALPEHPEPMQIQRNLERVRRKLDDLRALPTGSREYAFGFHRTNNRQSSRQQSR